MCIRRLSTPHLREADSDVARQISLILLLILRFSHPLPTELPPPTQTGFPSPSLLSPTSSAMAFSLRKGFSVSSSGVAGWNKKNPLAGGPPPPSSLGFSPLKREFKGEQVVIRETQAGPDGWAARDLAVHITQAASFCVPASMRWWEKGAAPNMIEIGSAQELVDSLRNAGDSLVVVDFYSPGCGGCKTLHPKICQFAESNPDVLFLKVNYEEHKSMCYSLNVHVLPFFRFYRGAQGRVCSFSCTNATIKKFKDAMAKHGGERYGAAGPAKGLEEAELLKLASNGELPLVSSSRVDGLAHDFPGSLDGGVAEAEEGMAAMSRSASSHHI